MNPKFLLLLVAVLAVPAISSAQEKPAYSDADAAQHVGEEATVTGKVFSVFTSSKGTTFLNFGDRFPLHSFGGVVFSGNQAQVGDLKPFEGRNVSVTGRIELAPDKKPQIVIRSVDQIRLAGAPPVPAPSTPAAPPPAGTNTPAMSIAPASPSAAPQEAASAAAPKESRMKSIPLPPGWSSDRRGGDGVRKDLARLFAASGTAGEDTLVDASMEIYPGLPFLTHIDAARKVLNLGGLQTSKTPVTTPGFPIDSFDAHVFSGIFPGGFNRLFLVTDHADQVVSLLLVDISPKARVLNEPDTTGYHTYNFISGGARGTDNLAIRHAIAPRALTPGVVVVETQLVDPFDPEDQAPGRKTRSRSGSSRQKTGAVLQRSRWFVPQPIVNLILRCSAG